MYCLNSACNSLFITSGTAEESLPHGISRRIVPCNIYLGAGCLMHTDRWHRHLCCSYNHGKTSKAIFSTARATGTWCIPAFYWSMIMPRAYRVAIHPNEIFQARTPPHHKQPRHTVPNAHGEMHELTRRHDTHNGRRDEHQQSNMHGALARTPRRAHEHGRYIWSQRAKTPPAGAHGPIVYVAAASQSWRVDTSILVELYEEVHEMLLKNGLCYRPGLYTLAGNHAGGSVILFLRSLFLQKTYMLIYKRAPRPLTPVF